MLLFSYCLPLLFALRQLLRLCILLFKGRRRECVRMVNREKEREGEGEANYLCIQYRMHLVLFVFQLVNHPSCISSRKYLQGQRPVRQNRFLSCCHFGI